MNQENQDEPKDACFRNVVCDSIEIGKEGSSCRVAISATKEEVAIRLYDGKSCERVLITTSSRGNSTISILGSDQPLISIAQNHDEYGIVYWSADKNLRALVNEQKSK